MDFQQQITEATDRSAPIRRKPVIAIAIMGFLAIVVVGLWLTQRTISTILTHRTTRMAEKYDTTAENLRKYELLASTLSTEIEQIRGENTELTRKIHVLEIQIAEAKKQADKAGAITEQLSDANAELDLAEAKIKSLTAEIDALRQLTQPVNRPVAMNPK
jgi:DNA repair exonuclease SbcCD ATPase subunit